MRLIHLLTGCTIGQTVASASESISFTWELDTPAARTTMFVAFVSDGFFATGLDIL